MQHSKILFFSPNSYSSLKWPIQFCFKALTLTCARYSVFHVLTHLKFIIILWGRIGAHPHFADQETETQNSKATCPAVRAKPGFKPHRAVPEFTQDFCFAYLFGGGDGRRESREGRRREKTKTVKDPRRPQPKTHIHSKEDFNCEDITKCILPGGLFK